MILQQLADYARQRVQADQAEHSLDALQQLCADGAAPARESFCFEKALKKPELSFICEVKKASPSKGIISPDFPYLDIARDYEEAGADCISCLTEPKWFLGSDTIFGEIRSQVKTPMIRKDFTVDVYQIYQAKLMGADAVLLITALLEEKTIGKWIELCDRLGMTALVETHDAQEIEIAVQAGARVIGVNNRNLKDFTVDFENSARLREKIPAEVIFVAESGVQKPEDLQRIHQIGADAVLIGEALMRSPDKTKMLEKMRACAR